MPEAVPVTKKVQKEFTCCFLFQKLIFPQNKREKVIYRMGWMKLREKRYLFKLCLRQYVIYIQQCLKFLWCQRRFQRNFPVVSPFKNNFLLQIEKEKVIYNIGWITLREKQYPFKLFFRRYIINLQQMQKFFCCKKG